MEIEVKTENFKKVVSCTSRATSTKAVQPILNNILLSCENGSLMVSATDLDLSIECKLQAEVGKPGRITLPAKKLDEIMGKIPGDDVRIHIGKNQLAEIISIKSKFKINGTSSDEFPEIIKKEKKAQAVVIDQNELIRALSLTYFAASRFESTSILSGVSFEVSGDKFEIAATDGSRLARYVGSISKESTQEKEKRSVVIPGRALQELERLLTSFKEGNDKVFLYFMAGQIIVENNDFSLSTRLISGTFPTYDKLIPQHQSNEGIFSRADLLGALERVAILANERTNVVKMTMTKGEKTVTISADSPDYGNAVDEVEVDYKGSSLDVAFNYRYLSEALRNLQANEVILELETSLSPIVLKLKEETDYDYTYLVMPVQLR